MDRAEGSIQAARQLASGGYYDFAASRAYYAAFYAATALLLSEGLEFSKHSAVIASVHQPKNL
ncbi:MAG: HEPN domain-containing protein [Thermoflexia bacterium]|nr:MAG: HEPN domain-containing protein [Thermoflexia bacterium]